jgi:DNA-binding ferritin-like protein
MSDGPSSSARNHSTPLADAFGHVLGNTCRLQFKTLCCKWNLRGPHALEAARLLGEQALEMFQAQDLLAERLRLVNDVAIPNDGEGLFTCQSADFDYRTAAVLDLVLQLAESHQGAILSIEAACDVARDIDDYGALSVLGGRLVAHQRHWLSLNAMAG